jgi:hypothetical protein
MEYFAVLIGGFGGGFLRGLIGFLKHQFSYKKVEFDTKYFIMSIFVSGVIGILTAVAVGAFNAESMGIKYFSPAMAFIIGYAGGDFLENIYKIISKKIGASINNEN